MPDSNTYTPYELADEVQILAENYRGAVAEITEDNTIFSDISTAIQSKTGQVEPYDKSELAQAVSDLPTDLIPKTITQNGVYNASSDNADGYDVVTVDVPERNTFDEYFANTLEVANIPSATSIRDSFFSYKTNLINVIMPNVTSIENYAFQGCTNLALTTLPNGVTTIAQNAFNDCQNLALTSLPSGVTDISGYAFLRCTSIPYLDFSDFTNIPTVATTSFSGTAFPFYFRDQQQLDEWAAATNWSTYASRFQIKPSGVI